MVAVRCLPGVGRITLLEALNRIRKRQRGVRIGDAGAFHFSRDYLTWVTDASRELSGLISSPDVDTLVLSDRYRLMLPALVNLSPHFLGQELIDLVQLELDERANALDGLISELEQLGQRWPGRGVFVGADTSFFLEADKKMDEYDFASLLDLADKPLHLFVPMVVVDELDKAKSDRASRPGSFGPSRFWMRPSWTLGNRRTCNVTAIGTSCLGRSPLSYCWIRLVILVCP